MADDELTPDDGDPLLVRPYISTDPAPSGTTWPSAADDTRPIPAQREPEPATFVAPPTPLPPPKSHNRRLLLLGGAVLVVALGTAGVVAFHPHDSPTVATGALPTEPLPAPATASPTAGDVSVTTGARTASTTPTAISPPASAATTTHPTTAATTTHPAKAATIAASPSTSPAGSAFSAAPAIARTGTIIGAGGLCLDLNGGVAIDGNHVQVFTCNGTDAQRWTLATDGTLRVVGKCAQTIADGTVHITTCNTGAATQWRQGKSRALVNVGTGTCLTDPRSGSQSGSGAQVAACTGAAGQQWSLP